MTYNQLIDFVDSELGLHFSGFKFFYDSSGFGFRAVEEHRRMEFGASFSEFGSYCVFNGWFANICFEEIESLLTPILVKHHFYSKDLIDDYQSTIGISIQDYLSKPFDKGRVDMEIRSDEEAYELIEHLKSFYDNHVKDFFDDNKSLQNVNNFLQTQPDFQALLKVFGMWFPFRRIVTMAISDDPEYQYEINKMLSVWKEDVEKKPNDKDSKRYYKALLEIQKVLENKKLT